jgi:hypothetical protein
MAVAVRKHFGTQSETVHLPIQRLSRHGQVNHVASTRVVEMSANE